VRARPRACLLRSKLGGGYPRCASSTRSSRPECDNPTRILAVGESAREIGIERFGAHDLRRTCAKLCRKNGGNIEQIKFLLGHSSIQTTERYLGSEQEIEIAVNDNLGL